MTGRPRLARRPARPRCFPYQRAGAGGVSSPLTPSRLVPSRLASSRRRFSRARRVKASLSWKLLEPRSPSLTNDGDLPAYLSQNFRWECLCGSLKISLFRDEFKDWLTNAIAKRSLRGFLCSLAFERRRGRLTKTNRVLPLARFVSPTRPLAVLSLPKEKQRPFEQELKKNKAV